MMGLQWVPNSNKVTYYKNNSVYIKDVFTSEEDSVITLHKLNTSLKEYGVALKFLPAISWKESGVCFFIYEGQLFTYNLTSETASLKRKLSKNIEAIEIEKESLNVAYVENGNIYISSALGSDIVTQDGSENIVYGQSVHRDEFGISKGLFWSKNGNSLAFYRMDQTRVTKYALYNNKEKPAKVTNTYYPTAGDSSHTVTVGVYNIDTKETVYLQTDGPYDQYLTNITWGPNDETIWLAWVNREQNKMELRSYFANSGVLEKVWIVETHPKYVEPEHPPIFVPGTSGDFIWQSERDGYNHLYLYKKNGKEPIQLTSGPWVVTEILGFDSENSGVYFQATKESVLERHTYFVPFFAGKDKQRKLKKMTIGKGTHSVVFNSYKDLFIDIFTSTTEPLKYTVYKKDQTAVVELHKSPNMLEKYNLGELKIQPEIINDISFQTRTYFPPNMEKGKKYPVIVYVYGGPHAQMISESWNGGGYLWFLYMAQKGYIIYTIDNRGSANRGLDFENETHRQLGKIEMADQVAAIERFKKNSYVDSTRIGVMGWSFGGFMTTSLMVNYPHLFKVGCAGGPVIDWNYYEIMYTERYMDKPSENPAGYANTSLLSQAKNLKGRLLMIHGTNDPVVLWQHSMLFAQKCIEAGNVNLDYFIYPGHEHNVSGPDRIHLYKKITQYFDDFLLPLE